MIGVSYCGREIRYARAFYGFGTAGAKGGCGDWGIAGYGADD